ncbi:replication initiation protein [Enterococcus casseliflavus]|nr:replication initiation protein [Enterococcus casseliflavus]
MTTKENELAEVQRLKKINEKERIRDFQNQRGYTVIKANSLIQKTTYNLTSTEQKLILSMIKNIDITSKNLGIFKFHIRDFCDIMGLKYNGKIISDIKEAITRLASDDKKFWIEEIDEKGKKSSTYFSWIGSVQITESVVEISMGQHMLKYLIGLNEYFTQYNFWNIIYLKSKYSIRLFELLKSYENIGKLRISVAELRKKFQANQKLYGDFKRTVLLKSKEEINKYTDIQIDFVEIKNGKSVEFIEFTINPLSPTESEIKQIAVDKGATLKLAQPIYTQLDLF